MENLYSLETSLLVDMLAQHTAKHTTMLSQGATDNEFNRCKLAIRAIQKEIEFRRQATNNTSMGDPDIFLTGSQKSDGAENAVV